MAPPPDPKADLYGDRTELASEGAPVTPVVTPSDTWAEDPWDRTSHAREGAQIAHAGDEKIAIAHSASSQ